jgi:hypothetical protein
VSSHDKHIYRVERGSMYWLVFVPLLTLNLCIRASVRYGQACIFIILSCLNTCAGSNYSEYGYENLGWSLLRQSFFFFLVGICSAKISMHDLALNSRMKRGSQSSLAMPRSLQHRMRALLLHASVAVGIPEGSKYSCSPRAIATSLPKHTSAYSRLTIFGLTKVSLRGARPQAPGPKALFKILRYFISGKYIKPSGLISMSRGSIGFRSTSAISGLNGSVDNP